MINIYDCNDDMYSTLIEKAYNALVKYYSIGDLIDIDITISDPNTIKELNLKHMDKDSVTDVLSFPSIDNITLPLNIEEYKYDIDPDTGRLFLGDIVICIDRAIEQAEIYSHSIERELAYLTIHGLLHLLGYDHIREDDRKRMRIAEENIYNLI